MDNFSITTQLTKKEYLKVMLLGLYRKLPFIVISLFGLYLLLFDNAKILGIVFILSPTIIILIALNQFTTNPNFKNPIKYTFTENGILVEAITCKAEFTWKHIIKCKEISDFLILYHSKHSGNYIDKRKLSSDQFEFIKEKIGKK